MDNIILINNINILTVLALFTKLQNYLNLTTN